MGVGVAGILPPILVEPLMYVGTAGLDVAPAVAVLLLVVCSGSPGLCVLCVRALMILRLILSRPSILHPEAFPPLRLAACFRCPRRTVGASDRPRGRGARAAAGTLTRRAALP